MSASNFDNSWMGLVLSFPSCLTLAERILPSLPSMSSCTLPTFQVQRGCLLLATITNSPTLIDRFSRVAGQTPKLRRYSSLHNFQHLCRLCSWLSNIAFNSFLVAVGWTSVCFIGLTGKLIVERPMRKFAGVRYSSVSVSS